MEYADQKILEVELGSVEFGREADSMEAVGDMQDIVSMKGKVNDNEVCWSRSGHGLDLELLLGKQAQLLGWGGDKEV